jgi:DNA-binding XRE family transcriptional regulator
MHMSQADLAVACNVTANDVAALEKKTTMMTGEDRKLATRMCRALRIPMFRVQECVVYVLCSRQSWAPGGASKGAWRWVPDAFF